MARAGSKKELILAYRRTHDLTRAGPTEIRLIQTELHQKLGEGASRSYIANVLRGSGTAVEYDDSFVDPQIEEPYAGRLRGVVHFGDLRSAEKSIGVLDALSKEYAAAQDHAGVRLVRSLALKAKSRAEALAANPRVNALKRLEKKEIANWFRVWLESPDLFASWVELRRESLDFRRRFAKPADRTEGA